MNPSAEKPPAARRHSPRAGSGGSGKTANDGGARALHHYRGLPLVGNTVSLAPHPYLDDGPPCALAPKTLVPGLQRRHLWGRAQGQRELEVQAQPRLGGRGAVLPGISFLTCQRRGSCSTFSPTASTLQSSWGPGTAWFLPRHRFTHLNVLPARPGGQGSCLACSPFRPKRLAGCGHV
ncbi:hypothetical protein HJG60_007782 [Phyllostomus discolor]|uniref:Uncharacterized protein n=1 Tax=Phyllostomus discolor TaxID=89673 RepID=A0A834EVK3_9CHIR|nr:hypothetical protein HJG60_007782 [Phyllostomus discolor]